MIAYIGIGANLGDAAATVTEAVQRLGSLPDTRLLAQSSRYRSAPIDSSGDDYINAVACIDTQLAPLALLDALQSIELAHGRERPYRNAPRTLDLDVLIYDDQRIDTARLSVPHPRMLERAFVLMPLLEIAPAISIPGHGAASALATQVADQRIERIAPGN